MSVEEQNHTEHRIFSFVLKLNLNEITLYKLNDPNIKNAE